jgi:plastocyanin
MHARILLSAATAACLLIPAMGFAGQSHTVSQSGKQFTPSSIEISKGDTVAFVNDDTAAHNVSARGGVNDFNSGSMKPGDRKEVTFNETGKTEVKCAIHPLMKMTITVK